MKITLVPSDMDAPGCYRLLFPGRQLAMHGHEIRLPPSTQHPKPDGSINFEFTVGLDPPAPAADLWVLQQRKERLWAEEGVHQLRAWGVATVADVDDNYLELPEWNPAFYGTHPHRRSDGVIINREARRKLPKHMQTATSKSNRSHMMRMFEIVDAMSVSTPYLKQLYSKANPNITVLRNYVDWDIWEPITPQYEVERWQNRIRVAYLGVFRYRRGDLEVIKDVIPAFLARHPEVDFVANHTDVHDFLGVSKRQRVVVKEYHFYPGEGGDYPLGRKTGVADIGLVPLAPGGMSEGKSHLKGMEYNAAGMPYIASNTESYRYWTDNNGFIAHSKNDWREMLDYLVDDVKTRRFMGKAGREKAKAHSIQQRWPEYATFYETVLGDELTALARGAIFRGAVQKVSELRNLLELASTRELKTVVEVGSARGGTFWALAQIADENALMVSIDIPSGSPLDVREGKDVYDGRDREKFRSFVKEGQRCKLIDGDSQQLSTVDKLLDTIGCNPIDVLFIDADHRYEGVKRDYELYSPLVREGGLIAFHDVIRQNDLRSGVHRLWAELKSKHPTTYEWVGPDNWGLGAWGGIGVVVKEPARVHA